jgi:trimeric autotransporter adhesin
MLLATKCFSDAELVFDLNRGTTPLGSNPGQFVSFGSIVLFTADDGIHGRELWQSDGTTAGTHMVIDLIPGPRGASFRFKKNGDSVYFSATDELSQTTNFYRLLPGQGQLPENIASFGNHQIYYFEMLLNRWIFIVVTQSHNDFELWTIDGISPHRIGNVTVGPLYGGNENNLLTTLNNLIFFPGQDATHGQEIWCSDGTDSGTRMVRDINPGEQSSTPIGMVSFAGAVVFTANDGSHGTEIWRTDGTQMGTSMVEDLDSGTESGAGWTQVGVFAKLNDKIYFPAQNGNQGYELYSMDAGFHIDLVKDIAEGKRSSNINFLTSGSHYVYFTADDKDKGATLWRTDGTSAGTGIIVDPYPKKDQLYIFVTQVQDDHLVFLTWDQSGGLNVWASDGTPERTKIIATAENVGSFFFSGNVLFSSLGTYSNGVELHVSNTWDSKPQLIKHIRIGTASSSPTLLTPHKKFLYFMASQKNGNAIWKTDGTRAWRIHDGDFLRIISAKNSVYSIDSNHKLRRITEDDVVSPVLSDSVLANPIRVVGENLFFVHQGGLWISNGTSSGTFKIPGPFFSGSRPQSKFEALGKQLCINDSNSIVWCIDTNNLQATKIFEAHSQYLQSLHAANGSLFFLVHGEKTEFWKSQGTRNSNEKLGETDLSISYDSVIYPNWFISAYDVQYGFELRIFDMNTKEISMVKDIAQGGDSSFPDPVAIAGQTLLFIVPGSYWDKGGDLWRTDGTTDGTFNLGVHTTEACKRSIASSFYFASEDPNAGNEPFVTDTLTVARVADVYRGPSSSDPCELAPFDGHIYFAATDGRHGRELWRTP